MIKLKKPAMLKGEVKEEEKKVPAKSTKPTEKEKTSKKKNKLPPDEYKDEIVPKKLVVSDFYTLNIAVRRGGELGLPMLDMRMFQTSDVYTGFTTKGFNIPLEYMQDLMELLQAAIDECEEKGLFEETD